MNIIQKIANKLIAAYGRDGVQLMKTDLDFRKAIQKAIDELERERPVRIGMIENKSAFNSSYYQSISINVEQAKEQIKEELIKQLYYKNIITEDEYKDLCHTK